MMLLITLMNKLSHKYIVYNNNILLHEFLKNILIFKIINFNF